MVDVKISALPAAAALTGAEQLAGVQGGANVAVTPGQIAFYTSGDASRPQRVAFAGDSIGLLFGNMQPESPWYWSLARVPRVWNYEINGNQSSGQVSSSGKKSGALWTGLGRTGTKAYTAVADDFAEGQLTKLLAYKPDILFLEIGTNDAETTTAALDATFLNVRDSYDALKANGLKHLVVCPILPRANLSNNCANYNQLVRAWARSEPGVHVLDFSGFMVDDASATGVPIGGSNGDAGAMTRDGLHPSTTFARVAADAVTACLDDLGIPRALPRGVSQKEIYNATTAPGGNLLGTRGAMAGDFPAGIQGGGASGTMAYAYYGSTSNAELTAVFSKGTMTDARGQSHVAQVIEFGTTGSALTANRTVTMTTTIGSAFPAGKRIAAQILAQFVDLVGCDGISLKLDASGGTVWGTAMGVPGAYLPAQDFPTSSTPENLDLVSPWNALPDEAVTGLALTVTIYFRSGTTPAGTVKLAQAGVWAGVELP